MKKLFFLAIAMMGVIFLAEAQVSTGINLQSSRTFITIGSNPDNQLFGEGRIGVGRFIDLELMGGYNLVRRDDANFYLGLALGLEDNRDNDFYVGIPFGLLVKPFSSKNLGLVLEAAPIFPGDCRGYLRGGFGFKYTFN